MSQPGMPKAQGLYDPAREHDACGIGAVAHISGRRDHAIIEHGNQILMNLVHRGAAGSDELTGDGAGILFQIPHEFLSSEANRLVFTLPEPGRYGVAMVFLMREPELRARCEETLCEAVGYYGLNVLGWRDVPTQK